MVFNGEPVWVPSPYLNSLQVRAPADVSGTLTINVQAGTVDHDDDVAATPPTEFPPTSGPGVDVQVSGSATLTMIEIEPVADAVTLALNGHASGQEDSPITLAIRASSSDSSETFNLRIDDIPVGATLSYGGTPASITGGTAIIENFSHAVPLTITPPPESSDNFTLSVSAQSVDGTATSSFTPARNIQVSVQGVADDAVVEPVATAPTYTEAALDGGAAVTLADLIASVTSPDTNGSETLSLRITGLAEDFSITGATLVSTGNGGDTRVWTAPATALGSVQIETPENYSGSVNFQVAGVTTEIDGDSLTGAWTTVGFAVTPSPEASATSSATLVEDEINPLNLAIIHQNGDTDETLGDVFIAVDDSAMPLFTLYLGDTVLADAGLAIEDIDGTSYYVIPAGQVAELGARGAAQLDGDLGGFRFQYEVIDAGFGTQPADTPETTRMDGGVFGLDAIPVTDPVDVSITGITGADSTANEDPDDDADPDTATVTAAGSTVTVNLHVESPDHDDSEHVIRIVIDDVPQGVTVVDAAQTGTNTWVLVLDDARAVAIDDAGGIDLPVEFIVGQDVGTERTETPITMTVHAQDRGNQSEPGTDIVTDQVTWNLVTELSPGSGFLPPTIDEWSYNGAPATEDTSFRLSDMLEASVTVQSPAAPNTFTVSLTDVPAGTTINGMVLTSVNGVPTWTASVTVPPGGDAQAALDGLLDGIGIAPPADSNSNNNNDAPFSFQASLGASAAGGRSELETIDMPIPVTPVTDAALITVDAADVDEGSDSIVVDISVSNPRDGNEHGRIIDGTLYLRVDADAGNGGGTLSVQGGGELAATPVAGVSGVPDGDYYLIDVGTAGGMVSLVYEPAEGESLQPGSVSFHAYARTQEDNATNTVTAGTTDTATVAIAHNGVTVSGNEPWTGSEPADADKASAVPLSGLAIALNDADGSETIEAIMLAGVPVGFLVYVGADADSATLAGNAGGDGNDNTWVLSSGGSLPAHVAILPPAHWSGTLGGLQLVVESGETALPTSLTETIPLADVVVTPMADGLTIDPTIAFGREGTIIDLNLNAAMHDPRPATATAADASIETTTLQFTGLGEHAAFYAGGILIAPDPDKLHYDADADTYTLAGLSQDDLDKLGFIQAESALADQVEVSAWTVESGGANMTSTPVSGTLDLQVTPVRGTTGPDIFIWGGAGNEVINGRAGDDAVMLRIGEDASGAELATGLRNIETIDLSVAGANAVSSLTLRDVLDMTDGDNTLSFLGNGDDSVSLAGNPGDWTQGDTSEGFTEYSGTLGGATVRIHVADAINASIL